MPPLAGPACVRYVEAFVSMHDCVNLPQLLSNIISDAFPTVMVQRVIMRRGELPQVVLLSCWWSHFTQVGRCIMTKTMEEKICRASIIWSRGKPRHALGVCYNATQTRHLLMRRREAGRQMLCATRKKKKTLKFR